MPALLRLLTISICGVKSAAGKADIRPKWATSGCAEKSRRPAFRLRDASFGGRGLNPELADAGWDRMRDLIYEGRGG